MPVEARPHLTALLAGSWLAMAAAPGWTQDLPPVPHHGSATHLGVATCASAACHGAVTPAPGGVVLQNEYSTWQTQDGHANAYSVLLDDHSRRIARNLGLPAAHTADICLDCHADNVPTARRGPQFQLADGVGCEACHGGAENWIGPHTVNGDQNSHRRNVEAGLYPTPDPVARAELCLSCHLGDGTKLVTHRIMGAGHPRLSFELDTFTAIQPAHFVVDDDYRARKRVAGGVQTWVIGQAMALAKTLDGLLDPEMGRDGLFPELTFFDCHACHKPMSAGAWRERASLGLGPGAVRFNDANLIMLRVAAGVVSPPLAEELRRRGRALHRATRVGQNEWRTAATALRETAREAVDVLAGHSFNGADMRALLAALVQEGERGEYIDYVAGEQTTMAIGSILAAMRDAGWIDEAEYGRVERVMADLYATVERDDRYRPSAQLGALRRLQQTAR
ncbi:MAG TPA: multiheme c-type cytochrome [Geminicoccaceae bacterium]|nr:multiheme c-type cytochrome [Geminicoccaceae bacterium]